LLWQVLLTALRDRDTVVRWSGAKGLARVTARLPQSLGCDVIDCILDLFRTSSLFLNCLGNMQLFGTSTASLLHVTMRVLHDIDASRKHILLSRPARLQGVRRTARRPGTAAAWRSLS
jgi:hypothetical protein